jgi:DNA-directed RNA polymerase subunit RPC12/RpoP
LGTTIKETQAYCPYDKQYVLARSVKDTSTGMHLLLTVLTAGLWIFVWMIHGLSQPAYRCPICGNKLLGGTTGQPIPDKTDDKNRHRIKCPNCGARDSVTYRLLARRCVQCNTKIRFRDLGPSA